MDIKGAGGTPGGIGSFILGFLMMCVGLYLLLNSIVVTQWYGLGMGLFTFHVWGSPLTITSGMILIPFVIGVGMIFFNARSIAGWAIAIASLASLVVGVIANIHFQFRSMTLFDLLCILVLTVGGAGLFLRSLKNQKASKEESGNSTSAE
jgi:hypothetical protein